jgi:hypothetical protein
MLTQLLLDYSVFIIVTLCFAHRAWTLKLEFQRKSRGL